MYLYSMNIIEFGMAVAWHLKPSQATASQHDKACRAIWQ